MMRYIHDSTFNGWIISVCLLVCSRFLGKLYSYCILIKIVLTMIHVVKIWISTPILS